MAMCIYWLVLRLRSVVGASGGCSNSVTIKVAFLARISNGDKGVSHSVAVRQSATLLAPLGDVMD